jgi:hypothetical protein
MITTRSWVLSFSMIVYRRSPHRVALPLAGQLVFDRGKLFVAKHALIMQSGELRELVNQ